MVGDDSMPVDSHKRRTQDRKWWRSVATLFALILIAFSGSIAQAQPAAPTPAANGVRPTLDTRANMDVQPAPADASVATTAQAIALEESLTPIQGYQGVLAETLDGSTINAQAIENKFNAASAIKLRTALPELRNFEPNHRFLDGVWASRTIDRASGTLNGDLIISGRDPSFRYEHAVMLARQLN